MTHTLHRIGNEKDFESDIVVMMMAAKDINKVGSADKKKEFLKIAIKYNPVNYGEGVKLFLPDKLVNGKDTLYFENLINKINDDSTPVVVFDDFEKVRNFIKELKEKDLGLSVIVSSNVSKIDEILHDPSISLNRYAVEHRLIKKDDPIGVYGKNYLLPEKQILEIHSMCGHGMISYSLIKRVIFDIKTGKINIDEGAEILSRPCSCGIFNKERAKKILESLKIGKTI